ncbi:MAG: hypothetical protein H8E38_07475 [SAR324 cluster bacterium]|nr:hypothetical protein [SAR324 cluster bacterium]MBL7034500.1 hypothetical protein [SAR324 cluster bacterium]
MRILHSSLLGLIGGLCSWGFLQIGFHVFETFSITVLSEFNIGQLNKFIYEGTLVGLGLGMILQARVSLWYHHDVVRIMSKMFVGALTGSITGLLCFVFGHLLQEWQVMPAISRLISWTLLGLFIVGSTELFRSSSGILRPQIISGGIGGAIGGAIFELLSLFQMTGPDNLFGLLLVGFSISLFIGLNEKRLTSFALRVLTGRQEGQLFFLDQNRFTLGYGSQNDFILKGYEEVCELHARIFKKDHQVIIENEDVGGKVLVNYRIVDQQSIKKGDVIKIGTALLQYYEI